MIRTTLLSMKKHCKIPTCNLTYVYKWFTLEPRDVCNLASGTPVTNSEQESPKPNCKAQKNTIRTLVKFIFTPVLAHLESDRYTRFVLTSTSIQTTAVLREQAQRPSRFAYSI